jgi:hypothetical protein
MKFEIGTAYTLGAPPICASSAEAGSLTLRFPFRSPGKREGEEAQ